ncbi:class I SAM-dependent DNA methyltransferase [Archangium sp. Cb G35]|uniref:HsdM family class I SAM-dependent methyltransferase n=1 Tax=Archangium sp. Cb G35 TaxID=1920190 RepID=UPI0009F97227|nr:N-6 DNA methylase [Archangium sp. Cb G35]
MILDSLISSLLEFGAPENGVIPLGAEFNARHMRYLDLLKDAALARRFPMAVVEVQGRPVLYAVDAHTDKVLLPSLRRSLTFRGDADYLVVIEHGRLTVYGLDLSANEEPLERFDRSSRSARMAIPELALTPPGEGPGASSAVHSFLLKLLNDTTDALMGFGLTSDVALSLMGRALFLRFLADRKVLRNEDLVEVCPSAKKFEECLANPKNAARTCKWLDETFNGDLLPLPQAGSLAWFRSIGDADNSAVFHKLTNILYRAESSGQLKLNWGEVEFDHVPVGLLSQVYEDHFHKFHRRHAKATSVHYTPHYIAEYVVQEAFAGLSNPHQVRVLDPAAGAGVFLVAAFRRLVEERWRHDGERPNTKTIRQILNKQVSGFEINESALRLAALSLYLTALEVDPNPQPFKKLKFDNLRDSVLFDVRLSNERATEFDDKQVAGSLGPAVGDEHKERYDLVIGNPPWTAWSKSDTRLANECANRLRPIVKARLGAERAKNFQLPDLVPDLPFVWRAMEWARTGGRIAFALHARLLFKQTDVGRQARNDLFEAVHVTGVLNATALRLERVWPTVSAPFCLLFADNVKPSLTSTFAFVSPELDHSINRRGRIRIDAKAAEPVELKMLLRRPALLKTLFRGMPLDVDLIEKIGGAGTESISDYWKRLGLYFGQGYQIGGEAGTQQDASRLHGLGDLSKKPKGQFFIDSRQLKPFKRATLLRPREREIYRGPVVIVDESPSRDRTTGRARLILGDVAYNRSFIGFSCFGHSDAKRLARYLLLILNSNIVLYDALLRSSKFAIEREILNVEDLERFPIHPYEKLLPSLKERIEPLSDALLYGDEKPWDEIDEWVAEVYGLNKWDQEVIRDTLAVSLPFSDSKRCAQKPPTEKEVKFFSRRVAAELQPFLNSFQRRVVVDVARNVSGEPWFFLQVSSVPANHASAVVVISDPAVVTQDADDIGASLIISRSKPQAPIHIGLLAQYRYWTLSQARLLALTLLREHGDVLLGGVL